MNFLRLLLRFALGGDTAHDAGTEARTAQTQRHEDVAHSERPERVQVERLVTVVLQGRVDGLVIVPNPVDPHGT